MNSKSTLKQVSNRSFSKVPKHKHGTVLHGVIIFGGIILAGSTLGYFAVAQVKIKRPVDNREVVKANRSTEPQVEIQPAKVDFGEVQKGTTARQKVKIVNTGSVPVKIVDINTTCGCTVAEQPKVPIPPGESAEIEVRMNVTGRVGHSMTKYLSVLIEGLNKPISIPVSSTSAEFIKASSNVFEVGEKGNVRTVVLESTDKTPFKILTVSPSILKKISKKSLLTHELEVDDEKWQEHKSPKRVQLKLDHPKLYSMSLAIREWKDSKKSDPASGSLDVSVDQLRRKTQPKYTPPVINLAVQPRRVSYGEIGTEEPVMRKIFIRGVELKANEAPVIVSKSELIELKVTEWEVTDGGISISLSAVPLTDAHGSVRETVVLRVGESIAQIYIYANVP